MVAILIGLELFARYYLGLGDPVLYRTDPEMEYLQWPSRTYQRLGHRISYNRHSMRAEEFAAEKLDQRELRVIVVGDSIVNAGSRLDQSEIATELLRHDLERRLDRPAVVGNIASNSWGPPNQAAYLRRFGLFDADVVIFVMNSGDLMDVPTFEPLRPDFPQRKPIIALEEVARVWLPQLVNRFTGHAPLPPATRPDDG